MSILGTGILIVCYGNASNMCGCRICVGVAYVWVSQGGPPPPPWMNQGPPGQGPPGQGPPGQGPPVSIFPI